MTQPPHSTKPPENVSCSLYDYHVSVWAVLGRVKPARKPLPPPPEGLRTKAEVARKPRRPPLDTLLKQAAKADKSVKGAEVYPDRTVLQFGEPEPAAPDNPWSLDEFRTKETKQ